MKKRLRNVLVVVVGLFVLGTSSQTAVCELVCGPQVATMRCGTPGGRAGAMVMAGGHCSHAMASMQVGMCSMNAVPAERCGHASVPVFAKGGSSFVAFSSVHWVLVEVLPFDRALTGGGVGVGGRPPLLSDGIDPVVVGLRV